MPGSSYSLPAPHLAIVLCSTCTQCMYCTVASLGLFIVVLDIAIVDVLFSMSLILNSTAEVTKRSRLIVAGVEMISIFVTLQASPSDDAKTPSATHLFCPRRYCLLLTYLFYMLF